MSHETAKFLDEEAADYRSALLATLCRAANASADGEVFMPLSLEVGAYNGTGPKPPNEQPYPFVPNTYNLLADYWGLWYNLVLHLDFWQFTDAKGLVNGTGAMYPWSGACKPGGATNPGEEIMPDAVLTTWGEQHGALWGGLPRFFSGLDAVYHGWVHVASRSISPRWRSIRFRLALRTYAPWGVRVVSQTKSRKIPTRKHLPLFFASRPSTPSAAPRRPSCGGSVRWVPSRRS